MFLLQNMKSFVLMISYVPPKPCLASLLNNYEYNSPKKSTQTLKNLYSCSLLAFNDANNNFYDI